MAALQTAARPGVHLRNRVRAVVLTVCRAYGTLVGRECRSAQLGALDSQLSMWREACAW
jgi:hypothetical protein